MNRKKNIFYIMGLIFTIILGYGIWGEYEQDKNCRISKDLEMISMCMNSFNSSSSKLKYINLKLDDIIVSKENLSKETYSFSLLLADFSSYIFKYDNELYLNNNINSKELKNKILNKIEQCSELVEEYCISSFIYYSELPNQKKIQKIKFWTKSLNKEELSKFKDFLKMGNLQTSNIELYNEIIRL